jgi:hypothetical protein
MDQGLKMQWTKAQGNEIGANGETLKTASIDFASKDGYVLMRDPVGIQAHDANIHVASTENSPYQIHLVAEHLDALSDPIEERNFFGGTFSGSFQHKGTTVALNQPAVIEFAEQNNVHSLSIPDSLTFTYEHPNEKKGGDLERFDITLLKVRVDPTKAHDLLDALKQDKPSPDSIAKALAKTDAGNYQFLVTATDVKTGKNLGSLIADSKMLPTNDPSVFLSKVVVQGYVGKKSHEQLLNELQDLSGKSRIANPLRILGGSLVGKGSHVVSGVGVEVSGSGSK